MGKICGAARARSCSLRLVGLLAAVHVCCALLRAAQRATAMDKLCGGSPLRSAASWVGGCCARAAPLRAFLRQNTKGRILGGMQLRRRVESTSQQIAQPFYQGLKMNVSGAGLQMDGTPLQGWTAVRLPTLV